MPRRLSMPRQPDVEITLGEGDDAKVFKMVRFTNEVEDQLAEDQRTVEDSLGREGDITPRRRAELHANQLDTILNPVEGRTKPSTVVLKAYDAGQITGPEIRALIERLVEEAHPN